MNTGEKRMRRLSSAIAPPKGKLGVLTVGMGAVATTFMAGVDLVRRKKAQPVGSLTQMGTIRLGKRTDGRTPSIQEFVPLEKLENFVFGGWDIFPDTAYEAAKNAAVLGPDHLAEVKKFLSKIRPMKAAFDQNYVKKLTGTHVKKARTKYDLALQIKDDIKNFQKKTRVSRTVVIWCGSTEIFLKPHAVYATPETFVADEGKPCRDRSFDALCVGGDHERHTVREWSSQFDSGRAGAHRTRAATRRADLRQGFQDRTDFDEDDSCARIQGPPAGDEWLVFD